MTGWPPEILEWNRRDAERLQWAAELGLSDDDRERVIGPLSVPGGDLGSRWSDFDLAVWIIARSPDEADTRDRGVNVRFRTDVRHEIVFLRVRTSGTTASLEIAWPVGAARSIALVDLDPAENRAAQERLLRAVTIGDSPEKATRAALDALAQRTTRHIERTRELTAAKMSAAAIGRIIAEEEERTSPLTGDPEPYSERQVREWRRMSREA